MVYLCILYAADGPTTPSELGDRAFCRLATKKLEEIQENDSKMIEKSSKFIKNHQKKNMIFSKSSKKFFFGNR